jgi:hypothetical protein
MAISLRGSRTWRGAPPISLGAVARMEHWPEPISLRAMATATRAKAFPVTASAGDVRLEANFSILATGDWLVVGTLRDVGGITGESYLVEIELVGVSGYGVTYSGDIGTDDSIDLRKTGNDPLVRDNFDQIEQVTVRLEATEDTSTVFDTVVTVLAAIGTAIFFFTGGKKEPRPCPDQGPFDDKDRKCVQFVDVGGADVPPGGTVSDGSATVGDG